ncbi:MAG: hypothetical protein CM15mP65_25030 [Crocinitomicaceae bacterium]|nr:MAG: hypothetical protein CM15mP65_25030 [Crocinitomicaceae bacterium]
MSPTRKTLPHINTKSSFFTALFMVRNASLKSRKQFIFSPRIWVAIILGSALLSLVDFVM